MKSRYDGSYYINLAIKHFQGRLQNKIDLPIYSVFVVNYDNKTHITFGQNLVYKNQDVSKHAEIVAIQKMSKKLNIINFNNIDATLYSTLEPCVMCAGFISLAKIKKVVFGIRDEKFGFINNINKNHHHKIYHFDYYYGFEESKITNFMQSFFNDKRS